MGFQDEAAKKSIDFGTSLLNTTTEGIKNAIELLLYMLSMRSDGEFLRELNKIIDPELRKPDIRKVSEFALSDIKQVLDNNDISNKIIYSTLDNGDKVPYLVTLPTQRKEIDSLIDEMYVKQKNVSRIRHDSFFNSKNKGKKIFSIDVSKEQAKLIQQEAKHLKFVMSSVKTPEGKYRVSVLENDYNKLTGALSSVIPISLDTKGQIKEQYFKVWNDEIEKSKYLLQEEKEFFVVSSATYIGENFNRDKIEHIHVDANSFTHKRQNIDIRSEDKNFSYDFENIYDMQVESIKEPIVLTKDEFESPNIQEILKQKKQEKYNEIKNVIENSGFDISFDKNIRALSQFNLLFNQESFDIDSFSQKDYIDGKIPTEELIGFNTKNIEQLLKENRISQEQIDVLKDGINELEQDKSARKDFFNYLDACNDHYGKLIVDIDSTEITYENIKERLTIEDLIKEADAIDTNIEEFDWGKSQEKE